MDEQVKSGHYVELHYTGTFEDGTVFDSSEQREEPLGVLAGKGMLIKGFDNALLDMKVGDEKEIDIESKDAYGDRNEQFIKKVKKSELGGDIEPEVGMMIGITTPAGTFPATISKVEGEDVEIDANHPLAGKNLHFKIKILATREPTDEDMKQFMPPEAQGDECSSCAGDCSSCK
jgi:peptidylprolyl isomerase